MPQEVYGKRDSLILDYEFLRIQGSTMRGSHWSLLILRTDLPKEILSLGEETCKERVHKMACVKIDLPSISNTLPQGQNSKPVLAT